MLSLVYFFYLFLLYLITPGSAVSPCSGDNGGTGKTRGKIKLVSSSRNFYSSAKTSKKASWGAAKRKDSGLKKGNKLSNSQVTRMGRNSLTEKSHY
jgi:hypothetical protein